MVNLGSAPKSESLSLTSADLALSSLLKAVCDETGWEYGESWFLSPTGQLLEIRPIWYIQEHLSSNRRLDWEHFHLCSQNFVFHVGEGLPGRVWATQRGEWIADVSAEQQSDFLRNQIAKAFGAKSSLGLPLSGVAFSAVLAFFSSEARLEDLELTAATQAAVQRSIAALNFKTQENASS